MFRSRERCFALLFSALFLLNAPLAHAASPTPQQTLRLVNVPILMYHYVRLNPDPLDLAGADLSVAPFRFGQQLELIAEKGLQTITLDDLSAAIQYGRPLPPRSIILTFDDGYEDFYSTAYPLLQHFGLRATSFIITGLVGQPGYLTWAQMREMQASGLVQFESHTVDHVEIAGLPEAQARYELTASKQKLESELGKPVRFFCFPSGRTDPAALRLLTQAGYTAGVGTDPGSLHGASDLPALKRVRIHGDTTMPSFASLIGVSLATVPARP